MKSVLPASLALLLLASAGPTTAGGAIIIDQQNTTVTFSYNTDASSLDWQQEIVAGVSGKLAGIDIRATQLGSATFYVNLGSAWQTDTNDFQTTVTPTSTSTWYFVDVSSANITLAAGDPFVMGFAGTDNGLWVGGSDGQAYVPGDLWLNASLAIDGERDLAFRTYMEIADVVPEPPTCTLLGLAAAGLFGVGRRRKRLTENEPSRPAF